MLVLSRKKEEQIKIGPDITITVVRIKGQSVRLGIDAPGDVRILRAELPDAATMPTRRTADRRSPRQDDSRYQVASQRRLAADSVAL